MHFIEKDHINIVKLARNDSATAALKGKGLRTENLAYGFKLMAAEQILRGN